MTYKYVPGLHDFATHLSIDLYKKIAVSSHFLLETATLYRVIYFFTISLNPKNIVFCYINKLIYSLFLIILSIVFCQILRYYILVIKFMKGIFMKQKLKYIVIFLLILLSIQTTTLANVKINSEAAILVEISTGRIIYEKNKKPKADKK